MKSRIERCPRWPGPQQVLNNRHHHLPHHHHHRHHDHQGPLCSTQPAQGDGAKDSQGGPVSVCGHRGFGPNRGAPRSSLTPNGAGGSHSSRERHSRGTGSGPCTRPASGEARMRSLNTTTTGDRCLSLTEPRGKQTPWGCGVGSAFAEHSQALMCGWARESPSLPSR